MNPRNSIAILALVAAISPLSLLRVQTTEESKSVWDGVYTEEQAKRGEPIYRKECASCHGEMLTGGESAPPLTGGAFLANWNGLTVGDLTSRSPPFPLYFCLAVWPHRVLDPLVPVKLGNPARRLVPNPQCQNLRSR